MIFVFDLLMYRKNVRPKKQALFKFESTGLSLSGLGRGQTAEEAAGGGGANNALKPQLICEPNPHNITPIYVTLMDFIGKWRYYS